MEKLRESMENYHIFSELDAVQYMKETAHLFLKHEKVICQEISDGNMNLVFRVQGEGRSYILKQAIPYIRSVGESWPLSLNRSLVEYGALCVHNKLCSELVPDVYYYDRELALMVMEDLSSYHILRKGLIVQKRYPFLAEHIGIFLAETLFFTSKFSLNHQEKEQKENVFLNTELSKLTEDFIFTFPYFDHEMNQFNPLIRNTVLNIWKDTELKHEVEQLKEKFIKEKQAMIHGDLHTGSIMVTDKETKVIDAEFARYGPMGFDIGAFFANILLNYVSIQMKDHARDYQNYLLSLIQEMWNHFQNKFLNLAYDHGKSNEVQKLFFKNLLEDTVGFAGCKMIRRVIGTSHVEDVERIQDVKHRAKVEEQALAIGQKLILKRMDISNIYELSKILHETTNHLSTSNE
jgi:5-methylthioribose kinase